MHWNATQKQVHHGPATPAPTLHISSSFMTVNMIRQEYLDVIDPPSAEGDIVPVAPKARPLAVMYASVYGFNDFNSLFDNQSEALEKYEQWKSSVYRDFFTQEVEEKISLPYQKANGETCLWHVLRKFRECMASVFPDEVWRSQHFLDINAHFRLLCQTLDRGRDFYVPIRHPLRHTWHNYHSEILELVEDTLSSNLDSFKTLMGPHITFRNDLGTHDFLDRYGEFYRIEKSTDSFVKIGEKFSDYILSPDSKNSEFKKSYRTSLLHIEELLGKNKEPSEAELVFVYNYLSFWAERFYQKRRSDRGGKASLKKTFSFTRSFSFTRQASYDGHSAHVKKKSIGQTLPGHLWMTQKEY